MSASTGELSEKYAGVLQHAHELLLSNGDFTFGQALHRAVEASDLPPPPAEIEQGIITALGMLFVRDGGGFPAKAEA